MRLTTIDKATGAIVDSATSALADSGISAVQKLADMSTGAEVALVSALEPTPIASYIDGTGMFDVPLALFVRRWDEAAAQDDCGEASRVLVEADLSGDGYEFDGASMGMYPAETSIDEGNLYVWSSTVSVRVMAHM